VPDDENTSWYGIRCLFQHGPTDSQGSSYEERVTIWRAASFDEAIALAEAEAAEYAETLGDTTDLGLVQAYALSEPPGHGAEVFSLIRDSALAADEYLDQFFDTGGERQQSVD
jgi:hypothetical protein